MSSRSMPWSDGADCDVRIPYMNGAGGNLVVLLRNGASVFRFTHAGIYNPMPVITEGTKPGDNASLNHRLPEHPDTSQ